MGGKESANMISIGLQRMGQRDLYPTMGEREQ